MGTNMEPEAKILIVEDDENQALGYRRCIAQYFGDRIPENTILIANDLATAVNLTRLRTSLKVVLLDLELPDSKPDNTLSYLSALGRNVIVLSGSGSADTRKKAFRHGCKDFLEKPVATELLMNSLSRILQRIDGDNELTTKAATVQHKAQRTIAADSAAPRNGTTNGERVRRWLAANAIPLITVAVLLATNGNRLLEWVRGRAREDFGLERRVTDVESALRDEVSARKDGEVRVVSKLDSIAAAMGGMQQAQATGASERAELKNNMDEVKRQTAEIYRYLLDHPPSR